MKHILNAYGNDRCCSNWYSRCIGRMLAVENRRQSSQSLLVIQVLMGIFKSLSNKVEAIGPLLEKFKTFKVTWLNELNEMLG